MATVNDQIRDLQIRHHVGVQRLGSGILKKLIPILDKSDVKIVERLLARGPTLEGSFTSQRLQYLLKAIREINHDAHVQLAGGLREEFRGLAKYEADFQATLLSKSMPVAIDAVAPSATLLNAVVTTKPFNGVLLKDAVKGLETGKMRLLQQTIQRGMIEGQTTDEIVRAVRGTRALNFKDGILNTSRTSAERMVRTATNHISNAARELFFEENDDIVKEVQWVATLDTRTCLECGDLDGETFDINEGPRPPLHLNCRCSVAPVTKSWKELGIDIEEMEPGTRASMDGQVSETETFNSWLRQQSAEVQDEALGPTRGKLFRAGGMSIDRFTDTRGNQLTLDELRAREAKAFDKAGV